MAAPTRDSSLPSGEDVGIRLRPWPIVAVVLAAIATALLPLPLGREAQRTLVVLVVAAGLWVSEAMPVAAVALLIPVLGLVLGVADAKLAFSGFGDPIVFLFLGTFLLIEAAAQHGLQARLASAVLGSRAVRERPGRLLWAIAALGCGISAWANNTATTAMILPLALTAERFASRRLLVGILLMAAYAPSLGGIATPVGTAPNLIGLRLLEEATGHRPSFAAWCAVFAPLAILFTLLSAGWMRLRAGREGRPAPLDAPLVAEPRRAWSLAERTLVPLFVVVVLLWIGPGLLAATPLAPQAWLKTWQARLPEPAVPLLGGALLFLLPSGRPGVPILEARAFARIDWSTVLLFGGGLSLGGMMFQSGLARALGEGLFRALPVHGTYGVVLASTLMAVLVSELTSNTASAALVVPIVLALAQAAGIDPVKPALAATVGCSFGFMLPVSTPPNALVFATGRVRMREMVTNGVLLDLVGVLVVSVWVTLFG